MPPYLDRRQLLTTAAALVAGGPRLVDVLTNRAASAQAAVRARGIHDTTSATDWKDGFLTGNGETGAIVYGTPARERIVFNHHRFVLPNGTRDVLPPVLSDRLSTVRQLALAGNYAGAQSTLMAGWTLRWTQSFHPGYELVIDASTPASTTGVADYLRVNDFRTGEITTQWTTPAGAWRRRTFVSRLARVIVQELEAPAGATIDVTLSVNPKLEAVPVSVGFETLASIDPNTATSAYLTLRGSYPAGLGAYGYEGVTRVVATGGKVTVSGATVLVAGASKVLLLSQLARYEQAGGWDSKPVHAALAAVRADYDILVKAHTAIHAPLYDRSTLDLGISDADRQLSAAALIARQNANRTAIDLALLERLFDSGRYFFLSSTGILPPRLTGLWAGSWNAAWADDYTTDANINLQISGVNMLDLAELMPAYTDLITSQLDDWRVNAKNLYGVRGYLAPTRTDGEYGHMLHFDGGFPGLAWTGGADWLLYPMLEYYQVTGYHSYLRKTLAPAVMELALFYEDFLAGTDSSPGAQGKVVFMPTYSPENAPANTGVGLAINSTGDLTAGRHALQTAIDAANVLHLEQGHGEGVQRWTALLAKLPPYLINGQGALCEWSWPGLTDRYNHRHVNHLYGAWPLHEINPEDRPDLVLAARRALELRGDENLSGHGHLHRALASARIKDAGLVYANLRKIFANDMVFRSMMTSHNPHRETYNSDSAHTIPSVITEALVYSRPGLIELLPAVPDQWASGTITGVRGRNLVRVERLSWDLAAGTISAVLRSEITQKTTLISRRGIVSIQTAAPLEVSPIGTHARVISLVAGVSQSVAITLPTPSSYIRVTNRRSGKVLDLGGTGTAGGRPVVQRSAGPALSQQWQQAANPDGSFRLLNRETGHVLDCPGSSTTNGTQLDEWTDNASSNQWWRLVENAEGFVNLVNVRNGLAADVTGGSFADGAAVIQWPSNGGQNQQWRLISVDATSASG